MGARTGDEGVAAFDPVDQTMTGEEIERPVNGDGSRTPPPLRHSLNDVVSSRRCMVFGYAIEDIATLAGQPCATALANLFGPGEQLCGAFSMIMAGLVRVHLVII